MNPVPVAHYERRYLVHPDGAVLNLANNKWLTPIKVSNGYLHVALANGDGTSKQVNVHRLVALHFLPNPYGYPQVNHKDGNKENNCWTNLEWCSAARNLEHALRTGLRPGYMSADDKERYLFEVLAGKQVNELAHEIQRRPETLHKMLRETAKRLGIHDEWVVVMKENRKRVALRQLAKINA